ncbi:hypothetical protein [Chamaesiphon minutus]|uniref:Uncharacterized protein n=1 Tax=Chamaesiphon minutus (strain ATCC 27169 / PCC 6605) TaxID=1173020 RepID=K9U9I1_CHAP6|nr:hypothetical protein [Chamaesiphon minutus]AFY91752.1 hypothetical protein Cha6605_0461 [Chamaesiphon minutus PCC 6605]
MERVIPHDFTIQTERCLLRRPSSDDIPHFAATHFAGFNDGMQWEPPATIASRDLSFQAETNYRSQFVQAD